MAAFSGGLGVCLFLHAPTLRVSKRVRDHQAVRYTTTGHHIPHKGRGPCNAQGHRPLRYYSLRGSKIDQEGCGARRTLE
ncbi:hypothetical protein PR003_g24908 [Phytophthora rubi]|uniref:Uncharacterized protein n=1 Tax=Phytophthora rubi TaxID=129364 RepID=A0A6A3HX89_9STRA|nr:hypothetical protein PR001_g26246 [Phytophthora rubi]KAE8984259.1 hypothetical protein PR002_g23002 [Phytophthora rubi]KAE9291893.1 hypothetical protein PR003_g24908 [Phytophthora rubi]